MDTSPELYGLAVGDKILEVNGTTVRDKSIDEVNSSFIHDGFFSGFFFFQSFILCCRILKILWPLIQKKKKKQLLAESKKEDVCIVVAKKKKRYVDIGLVMYSRETMTLLLYSHIMDT